LAFWQQKEVKASDIVELVENSVLGSLFVKSSGLWTFNVWEPSFDAATILVLEDADFAEWKHNAKIESVLWKIRVEYAFDHAKQTFLAESYSKAKIQYELGTTDEITLQTYLTSSSDATTLAQRYLFIAGAPSVEIEITERGVKLLTKQLFDKLSVSRVRAPTGAGFWSGRILQILGIEKELTPPRIIARLDDLYGLGANIANWTGGSALDWASAGEADKAQSGYWSDSNGFIDPADPETLDLSTWW
jgi:hypothetical protein